MTADEVITVSVDVTNTGDVDGTEVVQLYLRDDVATVTPVVKELRGFDRVAIMPGETITVEFALGREDLEFLNLALQPVVEPGTFTVFVGGSSEDTLETRFMLAEE
jgi:beta-glucosidase